jgi:beta-lysine N6-acetyltransferase
MTDRIEPLRQSMIQHGPLNRRVYVMKLHRNDVPGILGDLDDLARDNGYEKILVKVPVSLKDFFEENGYGQEAYVPSFFMGKEDLAFMSKFLCPDRMLDDRTDQYRSMMSMVRQKANNPCKDSTPQGPGVIRCKHGDAEDMGDLFRQVFESYPFPIYDPDFLRTMMDSNTDYFAIRHQGQMVAVAAAEKDGENLSVEMTDFATLPAWQGRGLAGRLLAAMESDMTKQGMITAFSISRAVSFGMNITLGKLGYAYGGLLTNNTNIAGRIESMTVWHKRLKDPVSPAI